VIGGDFIGFIHGDIAAVMELKIIEANGWVKVVQINRAITRVGSSTSSDIQLPSPQISPVQLQILYSADLPSSCRIINLGADLLLVSNEVESTVSTFQSIDIFDGDEIELGDFRLAFQLPLASSAVQKSRLIEAALSFPEAVLRPASTLAGSLRVKNIGDRQGVQFQVSLTGLPDDCYQIDPLPTMYPGAEEEVQVRLFHHTVTPPAGLHELFLTISAPVDYGSEELVIRQGLFVTPVLKHEVVILDGYAAAGPAVEQGGTMTVPMTPSYAFPGAPGLRSPAAAYQTNRNSNQEEAPIPTAAAEAPQVDPSAAARPAAMLPNSPVEPGQPKVKVVRSHSSEYWDE
jgi:hypothetical protein